LAKHAASKDEWVSTSLLAHMRLIDTAVHNFGLIGERPQSSFETLASRAPQDEVPYFRAPSFRMRQP
jgi:hypothetical protein